MESNKKLFPIATELFLKRRKLNISLVFISQSYFILKCFIMKIPSKKELQQIASNHLSNIDLKDFIELCKYYTKEPYSFFSE